MDSKVTELFQMIDNASSNLFTTLQYGTLERKKLNHICGESGVGVSPIGEGNIVHVLFRSQFTLLRSQCLWLISEKRYISSRHTVCSSFNISCSSQLLKSVGQFKAHLPVHQMRL